MKLRYFWYDNLQCRNFQCRVSGLVRKPVIERIGICAQQSTATHKIGDSGCDDRIAFKSTTLIITDPHAIQEDA